jgi:hypothetical protein
MPVIAQSPVPDGFFRRALARAATAAPVFAAVACLDQATTRDWSFAAIAVAGCLGAGLGAIAAAGLCAWTGFLGRMGRRITIAFWFGTGFVCALAIAADLGLAARLGGRYGVLAIGAGFSLLLGAAVFGLAGVALTPARELPSWLEGRAAKERFALGAIALTAALLQSRVEGDLLVGPYPLERTALRVGVFGALLFATFCVKLPAFGPRAARVALGLLVAIASVPFVAIREHDVRVAAAIVRTPYAGFAMAAYRRAFDWDRDGYSAALAGGDCDDWDPEVNPGQREVARNGRDDNCIGGDAVVEARSRYDPESVPRPEHASPVSAVLITVDTLSAAHVSGYGYARSTTPHLDRWAREHGQLFENTYTPATSTQYALSAVMRGVYPRRLKWSPVDTKDDVGVVRLQAMPTKEWRWTLSEWLSRRGMLTLAFVDDGDSNYLDRRHNIAGRFDEWTDARQVSPVTDDAALSRAVVARLDRLTPDQRFFLWVHYFGPHAPHSHHPGLPVFGGTTADRYDHEILAFDEGVAVLLDALVARRSRGEPLVVALLADHGEDLEEHHRSHGQTLSEVSARVPLVLSGPGLKPGRVTSLVSAIDVFSSLLSYTETPLPPNLDSRDLRSPSAQRVVLSEIWRYASDKARLSDQLLASDGRYRFVRHLSQGSVEFESVAKSPAPALDLPTNARRAALEHAVDSYLDQVEPPDF